MICILNVKGLLSIKRYCITKLTVINTASSESGYAGETAVPQYLFQNKLGYLNLPRQTLKLQLKVKEMNLFQPERAITDYLVSIKSLSIETIYF